MAKVTFLTFYNDFSVGVNVLSRMLMEAGHDVSTIFFKLPSRKPIEWFRENPKCMEDFTPFGDIMGSNSDVNKATDCEVTMLIDLILDLNPDILCISSRSPDHDTVLRVLPAIREKFKGVTLAGGYGPTFNPETYADFVDYVFRGEAENRVVELISKIEQRESIKEFDNICYKENDNLIINRLGVPEELPLRRQTITPESFYIEDNKILAYEDRGKLVRYPDAYSIFFGRGCIMSCSYCSAGNWRNLYKKEGHIVKARRNRVIDDVIDELIGVKNTGVTFVHFRDEFLTAPLPELKRFFHLYEQKVSIPFWAYLVPQQILDNPELLDVAVDAGFVDSVIGFQSGNDDINRTYFTRFLPNERHLEYARLLSKYSINVKYDFIVFNPAEKKEHIKQTFKLIQALPKERAYINCSRLLYLPGTPASELFAEFQDVPIDYEYYYRITLLYLICYVLPVKEFDKLLNNEKMVSSWQYLLSFYRGYLDKHEIVFPIGTHAVPGSITTHRYQRILKKHKYSDVIVWGAGDYYKEVAHIFEGVNIRSHIDDSVGSLQEKATFSPSILADIKEPIPIFICSPQKREIKMKILKEYPNFSGQLFI